MKKRAEQYRQGDVLVQRIAKLPKGAEAKPVGPAGVTLAEGEVTGHAHRITDPGVCSLRAEGTAYDLLSIEGAEVVSLRHEEHATIPIGPGTWEVRRQTEWDWRQSLPKRVVD